MTSWSFEEWIQRLRDGDQQAACEFVEQFQPLVRREIHKQASVRLLRRILDTDDIVQSVFSSFFAELQRGEYELESAKQLGALLASIARHQATSNVRQQLRRRRDVRRNSKHSQQDIDQFPDAAPLPEEMLAELELLDLLRANFTDEERALAAFRRDGQSWKSIATRLGGTSQSRRMQLSRAVERAARQLGLFE